MTDLAAILHAGDPLLHRVAVVTAAIVGGMVIAYDSRSWPLKSAQRIRILLAVSLGSMLGSALPGFMAGGLVGEQVARLAGLQAGLQAELQADAGIAIGGLFLLGPKTLIGGLLGGFAGASLYKRLARIAYDTSDAFARGSCCLMVIGRLGCIAQHCCFGAECPNGWGIEQGDGIPRWPVQIIEAFLQAVILLVIMIAHHRGWWPGRRLFVVFLSYGLVRFGLEFLREPFGAVYLGLGFYQWLALALAVTGMAQIFKRSPQMPA